MYRKSFLLLLTLFLISGCSWVKITPAGEKVRVLSAAEVSACKMLGNTTANVADKVAGLERKDYIVKENIEVLARNAAAEMGGDTVVPTSAIMDGKQTFDVYKCIGAK